MPRPEAQEVRDIQRRENFDVDGRELCSRCRRPTREDIQCRTLNNELICPDCQDDMDL